MLTMTDCTGCKKTYEAPSEEFAQEEGRLCNPCITKWAETQSCPDCGGGPISSRRQDETFQFRDGEKAVQLKCNVPIRRCAACEFEYLDYEMEHVHLTAINKYLISVGETPYQH